MTSLRLLYVLTIFLSATLLFLVQPMIAKMILPLLGGSPSVWNTCMVFFQAVLLLGYLYAHAMPAWLGVRRAAVVHLGVLLVPLIALPIGVHGWTPPAAANPAFWLLAMLAGVVGLPFFALATNAPLIQRWFGDTNDPASKDPYFLYAASNLGSMIALLAYPLVVEPRLRLVHQSGLWTAGYVLLLLLTAGCVLMLRRSTPSGAGAPIRAAAGVAAAEDAPAPSRGQRLRWIGLAFVPSSLMLGVTSYIGTDIGTFPLLWVVPLALYLLSFIIVFARPPGWFHRVMLALFPVVLALLIVIRELLPRFSIGAIVLAHLSALLVTALVCHGELARTRPPVRHLTEFYLWMALGGVLGGIANALIAPQVFDRVVEYPLLIVVACFLQIRLSRPAGTSHAGAASKPEHKGTRRSARPEPAVARRPAWALPAINAAWGLLGLVAGGWFLKQAFEGDPKLTVRNERDFFGVHRVRMVEQGDMIALAHGSTVHGLQNVDPARRSEPLSYFYRTGPIGQVFAAFSGPRTKRRVAVVGLGAGSLAAYVGADQEITFYEIDPTVERIASDSTLFTYLSDAAHRGARVRVVLGDARLSLGRTDERYGMIVLDAFSSDAVPVHLMTREALKVYLDRLEPDGLLAFNISSRYFDLKPVMAAVARAAGLACLFQTDMPTDAIEIKNGKVSSRWVIMARVREDLDGLADDRRWRAERFPADRVWTDDYSDILSAIRWGGISFRGRVAAPGAVPQGPTFR